MDTPTDFIIPIIGLKLGEHKYQFKVDGTFFKEFDHPELQEGALQVGLILTKRSNLMELQFQVNGAIESLCDRCGGDLNLPLSHQETVIVKFTQEEFENTDDVIIIGHEDHEIDVSHMIYELIALALPFKKSHEDYEGQACDEEVLEKFEQYENENKKDVDDRWSALKDLLTDKE
jgi:uncharacterized metal-binding protein YceD (DUF177 family)